MDKIPSFQKNHNVLMPGMYFSTLLQNVATFDLRFKKPNCGDYLSPAAMHTIEHLLATALRNGENKNNIIYFGPMGCRTGFYLLTVNTDFRTALTCLKNAVRTALSMETVPGAKKIECGNYRSHDLCGAKQELAAYLEVLDSISDEQAAHEQKKFEDAK